MTVSRKGIPVHGGPVTLTRVPAWHWVLIPRTAWRRHVSMKRLGLTSYTDAMAHEQRVMVRDALAAPDVDEASLALLLIERYGLTFTEATTVIRSHRDDA